MYGKINNGVMTKAPSAIRHNGRMVMHPSGAVLEAEGYKRLTFSPCPAAESGYCYREHWTDDGVQEWALEEDTSDKAVTEARFAEIESALCEVAELTDDTETQERLDSIEAALCELADIIGGEE